MLSLCRLSINIIFKFDKFARCSIKLMYILYLKTNSRNINNRDNGVLEIAHIEA